MPTINIYVSDDLYRTLSGDANACGIKLPAYIRNLLQVATNTPHVPDRVGRPPKPVPDEGPHIAEIRLARGWTQREDGRWVAPAEDLGGTLPPGWPQGAKRVEGNGE